jgi:hypothetical protein
MIVNTLLKPMTDLDPSLFIKVEKIAKTVIDSLKKKGYVVPSLLSNNRVNFDGFIVGRDREGYYYITNPRKDLLIDKINLPQTAAVIANNLALGRNNIENLLDQDKYFGFRDFDTLIFKRAMDRNKQDIDQFAYWQTRYNIARQQAKSHKITIVNSFEKLRSLR